MADPRVSRLSLRSTSTSTPSARVTRASVRAVAGPAAVGKLTRLSLRSTSTITPDTRVSRLTVRAIEGPAMQLGLVVTINGVEWTFREGSMDITATINGLDTLRGLLDIVAGGVHDGRAWPTLRQEIVVTEDGVRLFGGRIEALEYHAITADASVDLTVELDAKDFNALADDRTVTSFASAGGETLKQVLTRLVGELAAAGVTLSPTQVEGPVLSAFEFTLQTVRQILEELSTLTEFVFEIDYSKVLRMWQPGTIAAPFDLVDGDGKAVGDIVITPMASDYANRIIVRAGVAGSYGPKENVFAWYSDGVTNVFPMYTHVLTHFGQVLVDTPLETVPGEGFESVGAPGSGALWEFHETAPPGVTPPASQPGAPGVWPAPFTQWLSRAAGAPPAGHTPPAVPYPIQFKVMMDLPIIAIAEDVSEQPPVVEKLVDHGADVGAWWHVQEVANNLLTRHKSQRVMVRYATLEPGLQVGQSQTLTIARRLLDGAYFITDVATRMLPGAHRLIRTITAQETALFQGSWRDVYTLWAQNSAGGGGGGGTTVGPTLPPTGTPYPHHASHEPGGDDPLTVDSTAAIGSLRTLGTGANQAAAGNDARFASPWIDVPFNPADYTASSGTVGSIAQYTYAYTLVGHTLHIMFYAQVTPSVATVRLYVQLPSGFVAARQALMPTYYFSGAAGTGCGAMEISAAATRMEFFRDIGGTAWPASYVFIAVNGAISLT